MGYAFSGQQNPLGIFVKSLVRGRSRCPKTWQIGFGCLIINESKMCIAHHENLGRLLEGGWVRTLPTRADGEIAGIRNFLRDL